MLTLYRYERERMYIYSVVSGYCLGAVEYREQHLFSRHVCGSTLMNLVKIIYLPPSVKHYAVKCVIRKFWWKKRSI